MTGGLPIATASAAARAAAWIPAALWAGLIFYLSSRPVVPEPPIVGGAPFLDKFLHIAEYGVFAALLLVGLRRGRVGPHRISPDFDPQLAVAIATLYAFTDELHQAFVPPRQADAADFLVDVFGALLVAFVLSTYVPPPRRALNPPERSVDLAQGRLVYLDAGEGPPILYMHGWHGSKRYFEGAASRVPGFRHVALDLFGFGESDAPARFSYRPRDQAAVVRAFARALGIQAAFVVGHSMGGAVAAELALEDPAFVKSLVLVEPTIQLGVKAPFILTRGDAREIGVGLARHLRGLNALHLQHLVVEDPSVFTRPFVEDVLSVPAHASARALRGFALADLAGRLKSVRGPTLLVFGDPGHTVRAAYARALAEAMPDATVVHIARTSHCPMIEAPDEFYKRVREFLEAAPREASG